MTHVSDAARRSDPAAAPGDALSGTADLMEALIAAYALMAHADGEVAGAERRRIFAILRQNPAMSIFSRDHIADEIAAHEANFRYDPEVAQQIARERLAAVVGNRRASSRVVAACRELIPADGVAHPSEYRTLNEIKAMLGFDDTSSGLGSVSAAQR